MAGKFIGAVAREFGMNPRTLRFYEAIRLLPRPLRAQNGYRVYSDEAAQRLAFIGKAKSMGLSLKEIHQILVLRDRGRPSCDSVQRILTDHIMRIDEQMAQLHAFKSDLHVLLVSCGRNRKGDTRITSRKSICPLIETLGSGKADHINNGGERRWRKFSRFAPPAAPVRRSKSMTAR